LATGTIDEFVISHVRSATASMTSLVPMMKDFDIDSCEDDLSALVRELLELMIAGPEGGPSSDMQRYEG
jgi:hypothetical protein